MIHTAFCHACHAQQLALDPFCTGTAAALSLILIGYTGSVPQMLRLPASHRFFVNPSARIQTYRIYTYT